ncbi:unnamed protein product [Cuscuta campestris]|uniref:Uncharacterized protein n=1 Tax=Cuscuta campestris TaxID=132261 RepID=A0A484KVD3_9ASTE|nr:unnamed protein product [Cuscuta campestris]
MDSHSSFILLAHWNGEFKIVDNEVEYSLHANKAFVFDLEVSFEQVFNEFLTAVGEDGFNSIKKIWGKYPKYKDGVYAASRPFPISEEQTWRCFIQKVTNQYDELEVYLEPQRVQEELHEDDIEEEAGSSNTALGVDDEKTLMIQLTLVILTMRVVLQMSQKYLDGSLCARQMCI